MAVVSQFSLIFVEGEFSGARVETHCLGLASFGLLFFRLVIFMSQLVRFVLLGSTWLLLFLFEFQAWFFYLFHLDLGFFGNDSAFTISSSELIWAASVVLG